MRSAAQASLHDDALAGHLGGNGQADIGQHGGCDIGQAAALAQLHIAAANCHKGHNVGGVGGEGGAVRVHHLLGVAVVGGDEGAAAGVQHSGDHLIDPDTLWPAAYFNSVTVLCPDSGMADCLTTGLFCMPLEEGQKLVESLDGVEAMWCTPDKQATTSSGWDSHLKK